MLRAFGAFLVVFSVLSLIVHLGVLGNVFGMAALSLFAVDELVFQLAKGSRSARVQGETLL
jgi:hypothetical protein